MNLRTALVTVSVAVFASAALIAASTASAASHDVVLEPNASPKASLDVSARASSDRIAVGELVTFTVSVANASQVTASEVWVRVRRNTPRLELVSATRLIAPKSLVNRIRAVGEACAEACRIGTLESGRSADLTLVYRAVSAGAVEVRYRVSHTEGVTEGFAPVLIDAERPESSSPGDDEPPVDADELEPPEDQAKSDAEDRASTRPDETDFELGTFDDRHERQLRDEDFLRQQFEKSFGLLPDDGRDLRSLGDDSTSTRKAKGSRARHGSAKALQCTIIGGPHADVLRGTRGSDVICGRGGNDVLIGLGGDDILLGGPGKDRLVGGAGKDQLVARDVFRDVLAGGYGADTASIDSRDRVEGVEHLA
jgi:hypothetical protein